MSLISSPSRVTRPAAEIEPDTGALEHGGSSAGARRASARITGDELVERERLPEVVVGAEREAVDEVSRRAGGRQHEDA